MKKKIETSLAPNPVGPYSQGLIVGDTIYVSGQVGVDVVTGNTLKGIEEQTRQTLKNIQAILKCGGATMDDVVKVTVHLANLKYFEKFNKVYAEFFKEPYPVRTTVGSDLLNKFLVEMDVIAEV